MINGIRIFFETILIGSKQLQKIEKQQHAIDFQDIVKIITFVECKFEELQTSQTLVYESKKQTGLPRSLIVDFKNKSIIVLSKKNGDIQASGVSKKVTAAVSISMRLSSDNVKEQNEAKSWARLVNKPETVINPKEIELSRRFSNDVHLVIQYPSIKHPGITKTTIIETRYEEDISANIVSTKKQRIKLNEQQVAKICYGVCVSLFKMHNEGFVHKDISSSNVMIRNGQAKLKDFGFAHAADPGNKEFPKHKFISNWYGLPMYSAPEVLAETRLDDEVKQAKAEDMYAVGCLLYELISDRQLPWGNSVDLWNDQAHESRVRHAQRTWPQKILHESQGETNQARKALLEICAELVDPNPATRMTVDKLMSKLGPF